MANLILHSEKDISLLQLRAELRTQLPREYDVFEVRDRREYSRRRDGVKVRKNAIMSIVVWFYERKGRDDSEFAYEFETSYEMGSDWLELRIIPFILTARRADSPARHELEAEVVEAIRSRWPEVIEQTD